MDKVRFTVEGVEGDFFCDADEIRSYRTVKQLALSGKDPSGAFEAYGRIYMGNDEEYVERVGGLGGLRALNEAAIEAAGAKNSSGSRRASKAAARS